MKSVKSLTFLALFGAVAFASCGDGTGNKVENTTDTIGAKIETGIDNLGNKVDNMMDRNKDEDFLEDAVEANSKELRALNIGKEKGGADVKANATKMIPDHRDLGNQVMTYLKNKNITLRDLDTTGTDNDLTNKTGNDFDKAWAQKMVDDHEKVIKMFEDAQNDVQDQELKTMITNALPKLRHHLEMSRQLNDKLNK